MKNAIVQTLIERGQSLLDAPYEQLAFTKQSEPDAFLNDLVNYPHAYVLACVMDRQIKAERAWLIPFRIAEVIGSKSFDAFLKLDQDSVKRIFDDLSLHRFNDLMARCFFLATQRIHDCYQDNASNIWRNNPSSATIVKRFLQFDGVGIKIATMATNILAREFKIPMKDYACIDISPDRQVKRVFQRLGLLSLAAGNDELIYTARELNLSYPGVFDLSCWEIGRKWCSPRNPKCNDCYLNANCPKILN